MFKKMFLIILILITIPIFFKSQNLLIANKTANKPAGYMLDGQNESLFFFHHSFGGSIIAIGQSPKLDLYAIEDVGPSLYYAPKVGFKVGKYSSACFGTNIAALLNAETGFVLSIPIALGYNFGSGATEEDEIDLGVFVNAGIGTAFFLSVDPDDSMKKIVGPYIDAGFRYTRYEVKFSLLKAFKGSNDGFILGLGVGYVF
jgi:hypothetical protein